MSQDSFDRFRERSVNEYAQENVAGGRWPAALADQRARQAYERLLPQGLRTPGHHLFTVHEIASGLEVGAIWLAISDHPAGRSGYVYDIFIEAPHRRRGYGRAALAAVEALARQWGVDDLGLHVFMHNRPAQSLYLGMGFEATGLQLQKSLA